MFILPFILTALTLSGCWSKVEPKHLAVVNSTVYDRKDDGRFVTIIEIMNPAQTSGAITTGGAGSQSPHIIEVSEGDSISETISNATETIEKKIFGGHNHVRFFTENFAAEGLLPALDYYARAALTDLTPLMVVLRDVEDPKLLYDATLGLSQTVGDYIDNLNIYQPSITSKSVFVTNLEFLRNYYLEGREPVAGALTLIECTAQQNLQGEQNGSTEPQYKIVYAGLAAFKGDQLAGFMDETEARSYNFITNNIDTALISIPAGESNTVCRVTKSKAKLRSSFNNGQLTVDITVKMTSGLYQAGDAIDVTKAEVLNELEQSFNGQLEKELSEAVSKAQHELKSDIFGFGQSLHIQEPNTWKAIKENWDDYYSEAIVNITVEMNIVDVGEIKMPLAMEETE